MITIFSLLRVWLLWSWVVLLCGLLRISLAADTQEHGQNRLDSRVQDASCSRRSSTLGKVANPQMQELKKWEWTSKEAFSFGGRGLAGIKKPLPTLDFPHSVKHCLFCQAVRLFHHKDWNKIRLSPWPLNQMKHDNCQDTIFSPEDCEHILLEAKENKQNQAILQSSGHTCLEMSLRTRILESSSCQRSLPEGHHSPVPVVLWYFHRKGKQGLFKLATCPRSPQS